MAVRCASIRALIAAGVVAASPPAVAGDPVEWTFFNGLKLYERGQFAQASSAFQQVVAKAPRSSEYHRWLGRAYGRMAESSVALAAVSLALKARESLELAVAQDNTNIDALEDLRSFYRLAPAILGGDPEKAARLSMRVKDLARLK